MEAIVKKDYVYLLRNLTTNDILIFETEGLAYQYLNNTFPYGRNFNSLTTTLMDSQYKVTRVKRRFIYGDER